MARPTAVRPRALGFCDLRLAVDVASGVVHVGGILDRATAHHLSDAVSALRSSRSGVWTLDLAGVDFCDVQGLRVLQRARVLAGTCGRVLHIRSAPPPLAGLLDLLDELLQRQAEDVRPVLVVADG